MTRIGAGRCAAAILLCLLAAGCSKEHELAPDNPRDPLYGGETPPVPSNVSITVGNRNVSVAWGLPDSSLAARVRIYRIYQRTGATGEQQLADSSTTSPKKISGLANGQVLSFAVSSVLDNGLEGLRSREASALPGLYTILIEDGRAVTSSREVRVGLQAPNGTIAVTLGTDPDLTNGITETYLSTLSYLLETGDGEKVLYARFTDVEGNPSEVVSDGIRLDTAAEISFFDFDGGEVRAPGDAIVFTLDAGEAGGSASVEITSGGPRRTLRDDGIDPDFEEGDGIYTLRYEAEASLQFVGAEMIGHFQDEAGNAAPTRPAVRRLTVHAAPPALTLETPTSAGPQEIGLRWSRVADAAPFASYRVYRSDHAGVAQDPERRLVRELTGREQTSYTDTGLEPGKTYHYVVELADPQGFTTPSNEVAGTPQINNPPAAIVLQEPFAVTEKSATLSWGRSTETDFASYRLLRGDLPNVPADPARRILATISDITSTTHVDNLEIEEGKTYYYVVQVVDDLGATSTSNEVHTTIDDLFPAAVTLSAPDPVGQTTIGLAWTASTDRDFHSYKLYRSESAGVGENDLLIATITEAERTRWQDEGLQADKKYYYRIYVRDKGAHTSPSNEIEIKTASANPLR
jgi:fibronectin type 3 domain-containing protein